jgi:DNA polymerase III epsilon subunit family exonuclease
LGRLPKVRDEPSLVRRAVTLLQRGEAHTLDLAREVLGFTGNAGAASAAVFSLLGSDPRFQVDGRGCWSLAGAAPTPEEELDALTYAVVDVETTGGSPERGHRITEIAVVEIRDGLISEDFQTLVNPGRRIPPRISQLTGITDEMVQAAPFFEEVADDLYDWLEGRVFVAHNVSFDWRFVSAQLGDSIGFVPQGPRLCTLQLSRRLAPGLRRRNLTSLAAHFGIPIHARHRAYGDALATARVLLRLLDEARAQGVLDLTSLQLLLHRKGSS